MRLGVVAIARPTFDVALAQQSADTAVATLRRAGHEVAGTSELVMDTESMTLALKEIGETTIEALVVLQASFADTSLVREASVADLPLVLWAFPEARTGERLRLNSFCGINLAGFSLTNDGRSYGWVYLPADDEMAPTEIIAKIASSTVLPTVAQPEEFTTFSTKAQEAALKIRDRLAHTSIGRVGERPDGFEACSYNNKDLETLLGVHVEEVPLTELFIRARGAEGADVAAVLANASGTLEGLDEVDQAALDCSLRLKVGLDILADRNGWAGVSTRCWPETFTEFGGAACAPMAMLTEEGTPGSCEADVYGNVTGLILQWLGEQPSFVSDLVHLDRETNTGVFWHCGLAPVSMADPEVVPRATIHTNRKKPLLNEFPLKPGRVTLARMSQSRGQHRLVVGGGEMLRAPLAFSGTSGVIRFDRPVDEVLATVLNEGLEHHYGIVYADVRAELRALASLLALPVVEL